MARIKYLGGITPVYNGAGLSIAEGEECEVADALAADLVKSHPGRFEIIEAQRSKEKPGHDRMRKSRAEARDEG